MREILEPLVHQYFPWYAEAMKIPAVKATADLLVFLFGVSGAFWLLSKASSRVALGIQHALDRSLADLFTVVYNIVLALIFSSVLVYAIYAERGSKDDFLAYQCAGFALVYIVLSSVYSEKSGKLSEYALPGYWAGVIGYLVFCVKSQYLRNPVTPFVYEWVAWIMRGWPGKVIAVLTLTQLLWRGIRLVAAAVSNSLSRLTPKRRTS
jgi:hypothetical protein